LRRRGRRDANLPHIDLETVGNFAVAKIREALLAVTGP
jgi:hypothetical protein